MKWKLTFNVLCDNNVPPSLKNMFYKWWSEPLCCMSGMFVSQELACPEGETCVNEDAEMDAYY